MAATTIVHIYEAVGECESVGSWFTVLTVTVRSVSFLLSGKGQFSALQQLENIGLKHLVFLALEHVISWWART